MGSEQINEILRRLDALETEVRFLRGVVERNPRTREKVPNPCSSVDVYLSPRELAELILGHKESPRDSRVLRNMRSRVNTACCTYHDAKIDSEHRNYFGLKCEPLTANRRRKILKSEGLRWATRLQLLGWKLPIE